jgi:hypothetical protein
VAGSGGTMAGAVEDDGAVDELSAGGAGSAGVVGAVVDGGLGAGSVGVGCAGTVVAGGAGSAGAGVIAAIGEAGCVVVVAPAPGWSGRRVLS